MELLIFIVVAAFLIGTEVGRMLLILFAAVIGLAWYQATPIFETVAVLEDGHEVVRPVCRDFNPCNLCERGDVYVSGDIEFMIDSYAGTGVYEIWPIIDNEASWTVGVKLEDGVAALVDEPRQKYSCEVIRKFNKK